MKEKTLIIFCFFVSIVGIVVMFATNRIIQPKYVNISDINLQQNFVKIRGNVIGVFTSERKTIFLKIKDNSGIIDVVIFKNSIPNIQNITTGMTIEVLGKPSKYKEKIEIIASQIQIINSDLV